MSFLTLRFFFLSRVRNIFSGRSQDVSLAGVSPQLAVVPTDMPTTPPPTLPPPTCGAPYPPLRNGSGEDTARLQGSEYIAFSPSHEVLNYTRERWVSCFDFLLRDKWLFPAFHLYFQASISTKQSRKILRSRLIFLIVTLRPHEKQLVLCLLPFVWVSGWVFLTNDIRLWDA